MRILQTYFWPLLIGFYLLALAVADKLGYYINPSYSLFNGIMAAILLACALASLGRSDAAVDTDHDHQHPAMRRPVSWWQLVLAAVFVLMILLPPQSLSANSANNRQLNVLAASEGSLAELLSERDTSNYRISDWVRLLQAAPSTARYVGKEVRSSGFVLHDEGTAEYLLARYVVTCCAVDAAPVALPIDLPVGFTAQQGDWLEISGKWQLGAGEQLRVNVTEAKHISTPANPYEN